MKKIIAEFREFAMKGNVLDMAVGVVLGGAFSTIISSLVNDIITPLLSMVLGRVNIADLNFTIPGMFGSADIVLKYGAFLQTILNFLAIALSLFLCVKLINKMKDRFHSDKKEPQTEKEPSLTKSEALLTEIRNLLTDKSKND